MKSTIVLILLLSVFTSYSQSDKIDSLKIRLEKTFDQKEKSDILLNLCKLYWRNNKDSCFKFSEQALELSIEISDTLNIAKAKQRLGNIFISYGKFDSAHVYLSEASQLYILIKDAVSYASVLSNISKIQNLKGEYIKAVENLITARKILQYLKKENEEARILNSIGTIYMSMRQYDKAVEYYKEALKIMLIENFKPAISALYINIGNVYSNRAESESDRNAKKLDLEKAENYYIKALPIKKEINDIKGIETCLLNIGLNYTRMQKYELAEDYLLQSLEYFNQTKNYENLYISYHNLAYTYYLTKQFDKALFYAEKLNEIVKNNNYNLDIKVKLKNHSHLAEIYTFQKKYKKANQQYEAYNILKDSIYNTELVKQVNELEVKYQTEIKERKNKILKQKNDIQELKIQKSRNRNFILLISLLSALLSIGFILLYIRQRQMKNVQQTVLLEQRLLRSQMNPHFIFNSLTAIQSFILKNNPPEAAKFLSKFATLMRIVLEHSRQEYVELGKEIESLENYLELQKLRYENKFSYSINKDKNIIYENFLIPPMLAQPFIENAIEHGIAPLKIKGSINISFNKAENDIIEFRVEDNGVGFNSNNQTGKDKEHHSLATQITKERLKLLNRNKKDKIRFEIKEMIGDDNKIEGVLTQFNIPCNTH